MLDQPTHSGPTLDELFHEAEREKRRLSELGHVSSTQHKPGLASMERMEARKARNPMRRVRCFERHEDAIEEYRVGIRKGIVPHSSTGFDPDIDRLELLKARRKEIFQADTNHDGITQLGEVRRAQNRAAHAKVRS